MPHPGYLVYPAAPLAKNPFVEKMWSGDASDSQLGGHADRIQLVGDVYIRSIQNNSSYRLYLPRLPLNRQSNIERAYLKLSTFQLNNTKWELLM